jgi:hypothetical protein
MFDPLDGFRKDDREVGMISRLRLDLYRSRMFVDHDLVTDRQTEAGTLPGRFRREERREYFIQDTVFDADPVVPYRHRYGMLLILGGYFEQGLEITPGIPVFEVSGITRVRYEVDKNAADVLRYDLERLDRRVEIFLDGDIEGRILRAKAVISQVDGFLEELVDVRVYFSPFLPRECRSIP